MQVLGVSAAVIAVMIGSVVVWRHRSAGQRHDDTVSDRWIAAHRMGRPAE
jgi:hypothetical protein